MFIIKTLIPETFNFLITIIYIRQVLRRGKSYNPDKSDEVGRAIMTFFPNIECKTLPLPHSDKNVIRNIAQHTNDLNPDFEKGVQGFMTYLIQKVQTNGAKHGYQTGSIITGNIDIIGDYQLVVCEFDSNPIR